MLSSDAYSKSTATLGNYRLHGSKSVMLHNLWAFRRIEPTNNGDHVARKRRMAAMEQR
jgi:hypothetical protein